MKRIDDETKYKIDNTYLKIKLLCWTPLLCQLMSETINVNYNT